MREILFKAKRLDNGEWVEGALLDGVEHCLIGQGIKFSPYTEDECKIVGYKVDRNTLCQFTGLTDKNGNKIWENDIVKLHQFLFDGNEYEKEILVSIEYMEYIMCFGANLIEAKEIKRYMGYENIDTEKVVIPFNDFYGMHEESLEVIGNRFDGEINNECKRTKTD